MPEEMKQQADKDAQQAVEQAAEQSTAATSSTEQKPPWGSDEEFDPARAWNLIQNLRSDKDGLQSRLDSEVPSKDDEIASLTNAVAERDSKITEKDTAISDLRSENEELTATVTKQQLLADHGLPLKLVKNVVGNDADEWKVSVEDLKDLRGSSGAQRVPDPVQVAQENGAKRTNDPDSAALKMFGFTK